MKAKKPEDLVADALRSYAESFIKSPESVPVAKAKELDRALRSCKGISDIDRVWVRWCYVGGWFDWLTEDELVTHKGKRCYPLLPEIE